MNHVLIISTKIGGINTITSEITKHLKSIGLEVTVLYFEEITSKTLLHILTKWYLKPIPKIFHWWSILYKYAGIYPLFFNSLQKVIKNPKRIYPGAFDVVSLRKPDHIIATSFFPSFVIQHLVHYFSLQTKTHAIITNFDFPKFWSKSFDYYYVPNKEILEIGKSNGYEGNKLIIQNIPISRHVVIKEKMNLPKKSILFLGGSLGLNISIQKIKVASNTDYEIIVVCGENKKTYNRISKLFGKKIKCFQTLSSEELYLLYETCVCVVTKAGTLTLAEAAFRKIPIILSSSLEGHERKNANFLIDRNACMKGFKITDFKKALTDLSDLSIITPIVNAAYNLFNPDINNSILKPVLYVDKRIS